ncbi:unnamed protein product [Chondrus crispus]|uniref:Uncharacterized protein n=1 Tax=Chondrus crispus TaxID=2769 RepID=R7Q248_CHOCR|nr:unnamed protein product [Chondrus crispus]CDF32667.1 unnamed protein product [Chondrus crispus]|eukprot:XP_005712438.1 unnamed protein product [Chondrus crispus]
MAPLAPLQNIQYCTRVLLHLSSNLLHYSPQNPRILTVKFNPVPNPTTTIHMLH